MPEPIALLTSPDVDAELAAYATQLRDTYGLAERSAAGATVFLSLTPQGLALHQIDQPRQHGVVVDFASDALTYRRQHGGGRKEAIVKAVGVKGDHVPRVLDATAGLGRDAFVLASVGCQVDMIERSPVVAALLDDGLRRAALDPTLANDVASRMTLFHGSSLTLLRDWQGVQPAVVYLDPMFPHRKKSAAVKKEMRVFQAMLGPDEDADALLAPALALAQQRVVVKRPNSAPWLASQQPSMAIESKKHRFDVYLKPGHNNASM
ncbi:class I SAM-dependent methyltransferase [Aestuariibacter halophilus]|uniref:Ribosomal RNA small subunit methyltransferase J n=1 Tax=Fluctibacter halophilus TaxID=226011 RepID=A0ABS8GEB7_9ALTE|nr:class I SAM-dependent methyltransferase [Aestuariibacter halophilus]MCC2617551.1 class I SAM-dependent methyltransferase [Aestuariibacter halophilus]